MFTNLQSLQIAHDIQAGHRRRATAWRFARRPRRAKHPLPPTRRPVVVRDLV